MIQPPHDMSDTSVKMELYIKSFSLWILILCGLFSIGLSVLLVRNYLATSELSNGIEMIDYFFMGFIILACAVFFVAAWLSRLLLLWLTHLVMQKM